MNHTLVATTEDSVAPVFMVIPGLSSTILTFDFSGVFVNDLGSVSFAVSNSALANVVSNVITGKSVAAVVSNNLTFGQEVDISCSAVTVSTGENDQRTARLVGFDTVPS